MRNQAKKGEIRGNVVSGFTFQVNATPRLSHPNARSQILKPVVHLQQGTVALGPSWAASQETRLEAKYPGLVSFGMQSKIYLRQ